MASLLLFVGCKDSEKTDSVSLLEECKILMDEMKWSEAADTCEDAGGDEGYHLAAQAYMKLANFSIFDLILNLSDSSESSGAINAIFTSTPDTTTDKSYMNTALSYLMGSNITNKSQTVYLEGLLVSSLLVFGELKDVFGLDISGDSLVMCDLDATSGPTQCGFTMDISADATPTLIFTGLGNDFYDALCGDSSVTHDDTSIDTPLTINYDVTVDACDIQATSVLQYNKDAFDGFIPSAGFQDSEGNNLLSPLDFYSMFNSNSSFDMSGDEVPLCKTPPTPDTTSDDTKINDCEVLGSLTDPSSDLF